MGETRILLDSPEPRLRHVINRLRAKKFWARGPCASEIGRSCLQSTGDRRGSDSGDDLDPSLVHRLEPLSLLLEDLGMGWRG